jgi:hypothetical protein
MGRDDRGPVVFGWMKLGQGVNRIYHDVATGCLSPSLLPAPG